MPFILAMTDYLSLKEFKISSIFNEPLKANEFLSFKDCSDVYQEINSILIKDQIDQGDRVLDIQLRQIRNKEMFFSSDETKKKLKVELISILSANIKEALIEEDLIFLKLFNLPYIENKELVIKMLFEILLNKDLEKSNSYSVVKNELTLIVLKKHPLFGLKDKNIRESGVWNLIKDSRQEKKDDIYYEAFVSLTNKKISQLKSINEYIEEIVKRFINYLFSSKSLTLDEELYIQGLIS